jgi:cell division septation protein DedD
MSNLFDDQNPEPVAEPLPQREQKHERDVTLGMGALLAIFFGLVVLCAIFFGVGYQMGRRNAENAPPATAAPTPTSMMSNGSAKPSASGTQPQPQTPPAADSTVETPDATPAPKTAAPVVNAPVAAPVQPAPKPAPPPVASSGGSYMVQVAAVSHEEDAQVLVSSLKRHGYNVSIRHEPQDALTHVQVGPFSSKDAAKAMQQRLHDDGYAAILK